MDRSASFGLVLVLAVVALGGLVYRMAVSPSQATIYVVLSFMAAAALLAVALILASARISGDSDRQEQEAKNSEVSVV